MLLSLLEPNGESVQSTGSCTSSPLPFTIAHVKSGFAHFDGSHRENFCAATLLLAMEVDDAVCERITSIVRSALSIEAAELIDFGREARLETGDDGDYARVDIWLLFKSATGMFYAFIEVKTHNGWEAEHVRAQVHDQARRTALVRTTHPIRGSMLLAPAALSQRVREIDATVHAVTWDELLRDLRGLRSTSRLTDFAIQHLEQNMERAAGIDRPLSLSDFEQATTTIACLRQFLVECITAMGGGVRGDPFYMTPGDGGPRRRGGWAWHGLAVPFSLRDRRGRIGIYKYAEAPPGEESAKDALWLEAYVGDDETPVAFTKFAPPTLTTAELARARDQFMTAWRSVATSGAP